jgi:hypothetical protein
MPQILGKTTPVLENKSLHIELGKRNKGVYHGEQYSIHETARNSERI